VTAKDKNITARFDELEKKVLVALASKPDDRPLMSVREVAVRLGVNDRTARNYIESGRLASLKIEGARRVEPRVLDEFIASARESA
jgi:excisionase family DNA binding protein